MKLLPSTVNDRPFLLTLKQDSDMKMDKEVRPGNKKLYFRKLRRYAEIKGDQSGTINIFESVKDAQR